ncbi:hypothetical protein BJX62DRAFT_220518 [Aspergillus germanicus]
MAPFSLIVSSELPRKQPSMTGPSMTGGSICAPIPQPSCQQQPSHDTNSSVFFMGQLRRRHPSPHHRRQRPAESACRGPHPHWQVSILHPHARSQIGTSLELTLTHTQPPHELRSRGPQRPDQGGFLLLWAELGTLRKSVPAHRRLRLVPQLPTGGPGHRL